MGIMRNTTATRRLRSLLPLLLLAATTVACDDILDVEGTTEELGKDAGSDQARGKATYPAVVGLEASKARANELVEIALEALTSFDGRAEPLRAIASYIVRRKS